MSFETASAFFTSDVFASVSLLLVLLAARLIAGRALRRRDDLTEQVARRWTANFRNVLILVAVVGLVMIWAPQLRTFALSLTAVAVAIVVATKELILCLSGAALRTFTRAFSVGDVIEVGSTKGEVLDLNLLATQLKEFEGREGSFVPTGRTVTLPYSLLFGSPVKVWPLSCASTQHTFELTFEPDMDVFALQDELHEVAQRALSKVIDGRRVASPRSDKECSCQIDVGTSEIGKYRLVISLPAHTHNLKAAEKAVTCAIGSLLHSHRMTIAETARRSAHEK